MITGKNTISLTKCFTIWLSAGIATVFLAFMWDILFHKHLLSISGEDEIFFLIQGSMGFLAVFWALSTLSVNFREALSISNANIKTDLKLALKYFFIYALSTFALVLLSALFCLLLIKTNLITADAFMAHYAMPPAIMEGRRYLCDVVIHSSPKFIIYLFSTCVLIPMEEEIFFRRLLYVSLRHKMAFSPSLLISSLIFGAVHPSGAIPALAAGLFLGWIYEKKENLPVNIMVHGLINFSATLLMIFLSIKQIN